VKPDDARHLKDATRFNDLDRETLRKLYDKAMDPKFTTTIPGYDCIFSTRTADSHDMAQLKLEKDGEIIQILCTHAVALYQGKKAERWFDELSHLCGIRQCLVHTLWELPWDNLSRDGCHKHHFFDPCPHDPPCVPEPPYSRVVAAIQQKRSAEEAKVNSDAQKMKKRAQNAAAYAKKKNAQPPKPEKAQGKKRKRAMTEREEETDENVNPNMSTQKALREYFSVE